VYIWTRFIMATVGGILLTRPADGGHALDEQTGGT
jgi:hypothetical protein